MLFVIGRIDLRPGKTTTIHACIVFTAHIVGMSVLMKKKASVSILKFVHPCLLSFAVLFIPSIRGLSSCCFFLIHVSLSSVAVPIAFESSHAALLPSLFSREGALRDETKTAARETQVMCLVTRLVTQHSFPPSSPGKERCVTRQKRLRGRRRFHCLHFDKFRYTVPLTFQPI